MNNKEHILKFVADVQGIYDSLQKLIRDMSAMSGSLKIVVDYVDRQGRPILPGQGGAQPGASPVGFGPITDALGRPVSSSGPSVKGSPGQSSSDTSLGHFQSLRQENSSFHYLESQRALDARRTSMSMITGGKSGGEFLSERMANLSSQNNPQLAGTIQALSGLKTKFDELTNTIEELNSKEKESLGNAEAMARIAKEREDAVRAQQQIIQTASGTPGGGKDGSLMRTIMGTLATGTAVNIVSNILDQAAEGGLLAQRSRATMGAFQDRFVESSSRLSVEDLAVNLNPQVLRRAQDDTNMKQMQKFIKPIGGAAESAMNLEFGSAASGLVKGYGGDIASVMNEGSPYQAFQAGAYDEYLDLELDAQAANIRKMKMAQEHLNIRRPFANAFGLRQVDNRGGTNLPGDAAFMADQFGRNNPNGFTYQEYQDSMMAGRRLGGGAFDAWGSVSNTARGSGMGPQDIMTQVVQSMSAGSSTTQGLARQEEMMARAFARGLSDSNFTDELARIQTDTILAMANRSGGSSGAAGMSLIEGVMGNAQARFGANLGTQIGAQTFETISGESRARGGMQGLINQIKAQRMVERFFPGVDTATKTRLTLILGRHAEGDIGPAVWSEIMAEVDRGGGNSFAAPSLESFQQASMAMGQNIGAQWFGMGGSSSNAINRLMLEPGLAGDIVTRAHGRDDIRGGKFDAGSLTAGREELERRRGIANEDPELKRIQMLEEASIRLANSGIKPLGDAVDALASSGGPLAVMTSILKSVGGELGSIDNSRKAVDVLNGVATALERISKSPAVIIEYSDFERMVIQRNGVPGDIEINH